MNNKEIINKEIKGWKDLAKDEGWLKPSEEYLLNLPTPPKHSIPKDDNFSWDFHSKEFFRDLKRFNYNDLDILDVGAGRCWTTKELSTFSKGCVALDIMDEFGVGLDTAAIYIEDGFDFNTVVGDMNNMPFSDESFDLVYSYASMHHTSDLKKTLSECARVVRKDGWLVLSGEPIGTLRNFVGDIILKNKFRDEYGLNETTPSLNKWKRLIANAGFKIVELEINRNLYLRAVKL